MSELLFKFVLDNLIGKYTSIVSRFDWRMTITFLEKLKRGEIY